MKLKATNIKEIYTGRLGRKYDMSLPHTFNTWKKKAFAESSIKKGDTVLVFCCGTGLDFPHIQKKIGPEGNIIGLDFSPVMLKKAREKVTKMKWENVDLIQADVTTFDNKLPVKADVGVCTLGLSIIPDYKTAYHNLISNVKIMGEVIIGDMQLAMGSFARFNPLTVMLSRSFGGSFEGHENSLHLQHIMEDTLEVRVKREFFLKSYYYSIGKKLGKKIMIGQPVNSL